MSIKEPDKQFILDHLLSSEPFQNAGVYKEKNVIPTGCWRESIALTIINPIKSIQPPPVDSRQERSGMTFFFLGRLSF